MNRGTSQPDFFETSCASAGPCPPATTLGGVVQTGAVEMAIYSLTGNARSPLHAEPAHRFYRLAHAYNRGDDLRSSGEVG
jgi:hypothetical protein